jgi:hypothetical protein
MAAGAIILPAQGTSKWVRLGDGPQLHYGVPVSPASLYLSQLRDRLGSAALANIGD